MNYLVRKLMFLTALFISIMAVSAANGKNFNLSDVKPIVLQKRHIPDKPSQVRISSGAGSFAVIVKFYENTDFRLRNGRLASKDSIPDKSISKLLIPYNQGQIRRLFQKTENDLDRFKFLHEYSSGQQLANLNLYFRIEVGNSGEAEDLINQLNKMDAVEIAYLAPSLKLAGDIDPPTPDYEPSQDYLLAAPDGIDAFYADSLAGGDGVGVKIIDIELNWNTNHEDLDKLQNAAIVPGTGNTDHGTAVAGIMAATDNGYGVTGICHQADIGLISVSTISLAEAVLTAIDSLERGDIILIELQSPGPHYNYQERTDQLGYICMEYWQDIFDVFQYAWAKGIIVIEAAGNGNEDLDNQTYYGRLFDTTYRNSHTILVGAGAPPSGTYGADRSRLYYSNYGARVNLQGQGQEVYSTGYGDLFNGNSDINQYYTMEFGGTSSASPIVAGAAACLQGRYEELYGTPLTVDRIRDILTATGSTQQGNVSQHIGPRPNLAAAIPALISPPSLYVSPIYFDTMLTAGEIIYLPLWLHNQSASQSIDFSINGNDSIMSMNMGNWLDVSPSSGTVPISDSIQLTVTLDASAVPPSLIKYKGLLDIAWNQSGLPLDSFEIVPVFIRIPCTPDTSFVIKSSLDPGGPIYNWRDITTIGNLIPKSSFYNSHVQFGILDDGTAGPFSLRFSFPFYDSSYNTCYVGINGAISFTDIDVNSNGYYKDIDIPGHPFRTIVSPFWNDLTIETGTMGHGDIYYYISPRNDSAIFEWCQVGNFNSSTDTLTTFEIILTKLGDVVFQYKSVGNTHLEDSAVIGVGSQNCSGMSYSDMGIPIDHIVSNEEAVLFDQRISKLAGDCDYSGKINLLDISYIINFLYRSGPAPIPPQSGDVECNGKTNLLDVSYIINYLYRSGPAPCTIVY
jgi:subtilisin family serine protease